MKLTKLTPSQLKMKAVLKPIVEGILKEEKTNFQQLVDRFINDTAKQLRMNPRQISKLVCQYLSAQSN